MRSQNLLLVVLSVASLFFVASAAVEEPAAGDGIGVNILHVNPLQLSHYLRDYDTAIIFYYVDYCRVCNRLQEVYARASYQLEKQQQQLLATSDGPVKKRVFAAVNCGTNYQGCLKSGVRRVPVFKRVRNNGRDVELLQMRLVSSRKLLDAVNAD